MDIKKNDLVELESGVRLYAQSVDEDFVLLSIEKDGDIVKTVDKKNVKLINSCLVWFNLSSGEFSDSWKEESDVTNRKSCLSDLDYLAILTNDHIKLIEFTCLNDDNFEFSHMMKVR